MHADLTNSQHVLQPAGPQSAEIAQLWWVYSAVALAVCVLVCGFVLFAVWRRRTERGAPLPAPALASTALPRSEAAHLVTVLDATRETHHTRNVIVSSIATLIALLFLLGESIMTGNALDRLPTQGALQIEVVGKQWWWSVRYLDEDPSQIFVTANEIHVPVGRSVVFHLAAHDVIHSLWIPNLAGKRDLVPGHDSTLVMRVDKPGAYRSQCAEFCGAAHANMALWVIAEPEPQFRTWRDAQRAPARVPTLPAQQHGQQVFMAGACVTCHALSGTPAQASVGPDLSHLASRRSLAADVLPNTQEQLMRWIAHAQTVKPGNNMPDIQLEPDQLRDLSLYLESLK
jgi:cytochrome c oxidase subunit 2